MQSVAYQTSESKAIIDLVVPSYRSGCSQADGKVGGSVSISKLHSQKKNNDDMALCLMSNYVIWSSRGVKTNCQKLATGCDASTNSATELLRTCYSRWCFNRHLLWYNTKPQRWKRMHFASENSGAVILHARTKLLTKSTNVISQRFSSSVSSDE